jgi:hypothetical protein
VTTDPQTAEPIRIPIAHSVRYAARGLPEVPNQYGAGVLAPSEITLTYRAAPDSQLGRVHAYVAGRLWVDGAEIPLLPGGLYGQHYDDGLDGWPVWLAEEARLHDPAVPVAAPPTTEQTALRKLIGQVLRPWLLGGDDADVTRRVGYATASVMAVLPAPVDRAAVLRAAADALGRMDYDTDSHDYGYDTYRDAWNSGVMDGADLLRRKADEAAVVPPPALTEEGRLRMQVEVLQQDGERDQGLAKVGARCMREGHQGLIEQGRLALEGWRFALSTALGLGTGAPWEAIHERVKELSPAVEAEQAGGPSREATEPQPETQTVTLPYTHTDDDSDQLHIGVTQASTLDGETPIVYVCAQQFSDDGTEQTTVYVRPERVEQVITALRAARSKAAAPAVSSRPGTEQEA